MENTELVDQIQHVAELRREVTELKGLIEASKEKWELENLRLLSLADENKELLNEAEETLRELTIKAYNKTGEKKPAEGVGIRFVKDYEYDPDKALEWAKEHRLALSLDTKAFEAIAKSTPLDFVTSHEKVTATISKELPLKEEVQDADNRS